MRSRNCLPFVSIWVRSWSFSVVRIAHLFFCVLFLSVCLFFDFLGFIFALFLFLFFFCFYLGVGGRVFVLNCVPSVSAMSILDCSFGFP
jgi:hypothetical protein